MTKSPFGMILSAGFGTRLSPLTQIRPKTVMELGGYVSIYYLLKMFEKSGIKDVAINLHYLPDQVIAAVKLLDVNVRIHFLLEEEILGTAGAVKNAVKKLGIYDRKMVIVHGDIVCDINLAEHLDTDQFCSLLCATNQTIEGYVGSVHVDEMSQISELGRFFSSKSAKIMSGFFTGIHILSNEAVQRISETPYSCLVSQVYPDWLKQGLVLKGLMQDVYYADLGSPGRLLTANLKLFEETFSSIDVFEHFEKISGLPNSYIGRNVTISPSAKIVDPVIIADDADIGPYTIIGPQAVIGKKARVKNQASVKRSLVMSETVIEKDENLDCVIALSHARVKVA